MLQNTDLFIVERGGLQYRMTADEVAQFVGAIKDYTAATIPARDAGTLIPSGVPIKAGDRIFVTDATADATVDAGWAVYRVVSISPDVFEKIQEQESLDLVITAATDLSYTPSPGQGTVVSSTGNDAVIPLADATNAGLMSPGAFNNIHVPALAGLTAATNPVNVNGANQQITFGIAQLTPLP